jgi:2-amino-4-hydroxy-6-hydroxymethyldihydropteridine diphosphokinase
MPLFYQKVVIAFGCNIGNCQKQIEEALKFLTENVLIKNVSSIYISEPYGVENQPQFHNGVLIGYTKLSPYKLLNFLKDIEKKVGRKERCRWCEREIDLDIVYYENLKLNREDLKIPHYDRLNRKFVVEPLLELEPTFYDPIVGSLKTYAKRRLSY